MVLVLLVLLEGEVTTLSVGIAASFIMLRKVAFVFSLPQEI